MNKKYILINILIILIMLVIAIIPNYSYAASVNKTQASDLGLGDLNKYEGSNIGSKKLENKANYIFSVIRNVGIVLSVIVLIIIGIKYMLGSVEEKANYKETLMPYLIGAILLFTGSLIPQLIYKLMQNF